MSSLSKISIETKNKKCLHLKIERIHPDAPSINWLVEQTEVKVKSALLFRFLNLLEPIQHENGKILKIYSHIFEMVCPFIEEEYGEQLELNKYTELTEYGSEILENISDQILSSVKLIEQDLNENWEKGLIKNFNPYKSSESKVPFLKYEMLFREEFLENEYSGMADYSALSISCIFK